MVRLALPTRGALCALILTATVAATAPPPPSRSTTKTPPAPPAACGSKRTCGEMTSCAEARFYLEHCGLARLDGDKDGTPCESLCR
jgi:Excalibur calcium-binding domain